MQMYQRKNRRFVEIEGQDAEKFLQNLLSQNLNLLKANVDQAVLSCLLNQKGGVEAYFWVSLNQDRYVLDMHKTMLDGVLDIFQSYKLRSRVDFNLLPIQYSYYSLEKADLGAQTQQHKITINGQILYRSIILDNDKVEALNLGVWSEPAWELFRIQQRWPKWLQDVKSGMLVLQSDFLKQGVALDKGCYLGQETVARVHARGERVARKLFNVKAPLNRLSAGDTLSKGDEKKIIGMISSVVHSEKNQEDWALAMLHREAWDEKTLVSSANVKVEVNA
ncbi:hypothetical protein MRY82_03050 [bacterium]|nr:hypothetical protein [bacterium]